MFKVTKHAMLVSAALLLTRLPAKADTFSFQFQGAINSGSGTFLTTSLFTSPDCPPSQGGCYAITGITGQFDGNDITTILPLGDYWAMVTPSLQLRTISPLGFDADAQMWGINQTSSGTMLFGISYHSPRPDYEYTGNGFSEPISLQIPAADLPIGVLLISGLFLWSFFASSRRRTAVSFVGSK
jgi:hypothetical protein